MGAHLLRREAGQRHPLGEQAGGGQQGGSRAAGRPEYLDRRPTAVRAREGVGEFQDAVHIGAPEGVDRLVGVAEGDKGAPAAREGAQQPHLRGVGVLVLVHVDGVVLGGEALGDLGAPGEEHRAVDEFRVVEHSLHVEDVEVLGEEGRRRTPVGAADAPGEGIQGVGAQAQFTAAGEDRADLVGETAGGQAGAQFVGPAHMGEAEPLQVGLAREQLAHRHVLLGTGQQPQRLHEEVAVLVGADQGVAEGVEGGGLGRAGGPYAQRHTVAQFDGRPSAEREHQDPLRVAVPCDPGGHGLDECGRLAGARTCENEQRAAPVVNHRALPCVQTRGIHPDRRRTHQSVRAAGPLAHLGVRQAPVGRGGAHVVRRSWWLCDLSLPALSADVEAWWSGDGWVDHRAWRAVAAR